MEPNLQLLYFHRDSGNYKTFGAVIFVNPENLTPEMAEKRFRAQLIDTESFFCADWNLPPLLPSDPATEGDWYEFIKFTPSTKQITDLRNMEEFLEWKVRTQ